MRLSESDNDTRVRSFASSPDRSLHTQFLDKIGDVEWREGKNLNEKRKEKTHKFDGKIIKSNSSSGKWKMKIQ